MRGVQTEHLLRIMIAALILLATFHLGVGEHSATLTVVTLIVLAVSAYVTDATKIFFLRQSMANCAALGIVLVTAIAAYQTDRIGQLQAVADLQSYLQYVLLFQPKTVRVYWQLAALSLGQQAIASTLVPGPLFGIMLLLYVFAGIITFALLLLDTESRRFARPAAQAEDRPALAAGGGDAASRLPMLFGNVAPATARSIGWGIARQAALISAMGLMFAVVLFLLLPRWNIENREVASREPLRSVGFSKTVTLGELGEVIHNPDVVMRIQFQEVHGQERQSFKLVGEPLFRGTLLTHYEDGNWTQPRFSSYMSVPVELRTDYVSQRITAEPLDAAELCCIFPVFAVESSPQLRISAPRRDNLIRQEDYRERQLDIEIGTTGIANKSQRRILPCENRISPKEMDRLLQMPDAYRDQPGDPFHGLRGAAAAVLSDKKIDPKNHMAAALALNDALRGSGQYFYSLEAQQRAEALDPLEDFVTIHRLGHCEYFSGALVMMLRSQGIPARMALGFKGGEWNSLGMYYQVQQLHAHSWVEVYLEPEEIPDGALVEAGDPWGAWLSLDPTEGVQERSQAGLSAGPLARLRQYLDYTRVLWANYVVGLNATRQQQTIYEPLAVGTGSAIETVVSRQAWKSRSRELANSHVGVFWQWYRRHWFSWRGGSVAVGFLLVLAALVWAARRSLGALGRWGLVSLSRTVHEPPVLEMYRRLEAALARHGLRRLPGQTAYEFALAAGGDLAENLEHRRLAPLPRRIVEVFYRVRFGGRTLDNLEADAVEHALVELELALGRYR